MPDVFDLVVDGGSVLDGAGAGAVEGWVAVRGDRIAAFGRDPDPPPEAARRIDARQAVVAPGFVDVHTHSDLVPFVEPWMDSALRMGCTTVVVGNCGSSPWPTAGLDEMASLTGIRGSAPAGWSSFGAYLDAMERQRPAVNVAALVGLGAIRMEVLGLQRRAPDDDELEAMRRFARDAVEDGALGLSTGLIYVPDLFSTTDEVVAVATELAPFGGIYASHIRGEGEHLFRAIDEAIEIGRRAGVRAHVSHLKCESRLVWGRADELLARVHEAEDATADQYPYAAWGSNLGSFLPPWAPVAELAAIVRTDHDRLVHAIEEGEDAFQSSVRGVGWERIVIESCLDEDAIGKDLAAIAAERGIEPVDACLRLLVEDPDTACIGHAMDEADVRTILADPDVAVASDSSAMSPEGPLGRFPVHPRTYGTFPRALAAVRDGVLDLPTAIRKMTSLPADRFGLTDRGRIAEGAFADLVVLRPEVVEDRARFGDPHRFPDGIDVVVVNGREAWDGERGERAGRVLRRS